MERRRSSILCKIGVRRPILVQDYCTVKTSLKVLVHCRLDWSGETNLYATESTQFVESNLGKRSLWKKCTVYCRRYKDRDTHFRTTTVLSRFWPYQVQHSAVCQIGLGAVIIMCSNF
ncbi:hypothetical protein M8J77_013736 [Diaphorina citri]|nr:hypothetical protein M8J77_013736 [Diaphorina citri]